MNNKVLLLIWLLAMSFTLSGCSSDSSNNTDSELSEVANSETSDSEDVELSDLVTISENECASGIVIIFDNANNIDVTIHGNITYYDENNSMVGSDEAYLWDCAKNGNGSVIFELPENGYASFKTSYYITDAHKTPEDCNRQADYTVNASLTDEGFVVAEFTNKNNEPIDEFDVACVYYKDGKMLSYTRETKFKCTPVFSVEFSEPRDSDFKLLDETADSFEIFINGTTKY